MQFTHFTLKFTLDLKYIAPNWLRHRKLYAIKGVGEVFQIRFCVKAFLGWWIENKKNSRGGGWLDWTRESNWLHALQGIIRIHNFDQHHNLDHTAYYPIERLMICTIMENDTCIYSDSGFQLFLFCSCVDYLPWIHAEDSASQDNLEWAIIDWKGAK